MFRHIQLLAACLLITVVPAAVIAQSEPNPFGMLKGIKTGNSNADNIFNNLAKSADTKGGSNAAAGSSSGGDSWDTSSPGTAAPVGDSDKRTVMSDINSDNGSIENRCGARIPISVDWASFEGHAAEDQSCARWASGIADACSAGHTGTVKGIKRAVCRYGATRSLTLKSGTLTFTVPSNADDNDEFVANELARH